MELRHLRYFVAVAEELHFRRAAERLHVAQPAVSEQVRKLEAELGVRLLDRDHRSVSLTDAGAAMLDEARQVLVQADVAQRAARQAGDRATGRLRVGYLPDALPVSVPRLLRRFSTMAPGARISFETGGARHLLEAVREGRIDVAVTCLPAPIAGLRVVRIGEEQAVAAVPEGHPCSTEAEISLGWLERTPLVQLGRPINPAFYDAVLGACAAAGIAPALVEVDSPSVEQVLLAVAAGTGIALLPASTASRFSAAGVRFRSVAAPAPTCAVAVVARSEAGTTCTTFLRLADQIQPARPVLAAVA
jgi:DNA-binding transcriptional LysR family regulator